MSVTSKRTQHSAILWLIVINGVVVVPVPGLHDGEVPTEEEAMSPLSLVYFKVDDDCPSVPWWVSSCRNQMSGPPMKRARIYSEVSYCDFF